MYKRYIMGFYYIGIVLFRVFPDLESALKIARKCGKIRKNQEKIYLIGIPFRVLPHGFQGPLYISKYKN